MTTRSPLEQLLALPEPEQRVLALFATVHEALNRTAMLQWLRGTDLRLIASRAVSSTDLSILLTRWVKAGLLIDVSDGHQQFRVPRSLAHAVLDRLAKRGELQALATRVREQAPLAAQSVYMIDPSRLGRELLLSLYLGDNEQGTDALTTWESRYRGVTHEALILDAFGLDVPKARLTGHLSGAVAQRYASAVMDIGVTRLVEVGPDTCAWLVEKRAGLLPSTCIRAAYYFALRGEPATALSFLPELENADSCAARSFILLSENKLDEARSVALRAIERARGKSKKVKPVDELFAPWLILCLLTAGESEAVEQALTQLQLWTKKPSEHTFALFMLKVLEQHLTAPDGPREIVGRYTGHASRWLDVLFAGLVCRFVEQKHSPALSDQLLRMANTAQGRGFRFLGAELLRVHEGELKQGLGLLYQREEEWARVVRALDVAIAQAENLTDSSDGATEERLVWVLVIDATGHQLSARVQTRTAKGFSNGRQVSWKKLAEAGIDAAWIAPEDRRVLQHIKLYKGNQYHGAPSQYAIEAEAPLSLVGHPRVFGDYDLRKPVDVVRGPTRLEVRKEGEQIAIGVVPSACLDQGVVCERDGAQRIVVYGLTRAQRVIAAQLTKKGVVLPAAAHAPLQRTLARLVTHFAVASDVDVEGAQIEEVPADPRIHVQLRRLGAGVAVRLCVAPLGSAPLFNPGEGSASVLGSYGSGEHACTARTMRDLTVERAALQHLRDCCPTLSSYETDQRELRIEDLVSCLELLCGLQALKDEVVVEWPSGQPLSLVAERGSEHLRVSLSSRGDWLAADGELDVDPELKLSLRDLLARAASAKGRFIALDDGRFVALTENLRKTLDGMAALSTTKGERVELHPLALGSLASQSDQFARFKQDKGVAARLAKVREAARLEPKLPSSFEADLRPYQQEGFEWLTRLTHWGAGACLADDMGLGKTLQALALMVARAPNGPSIVVAPMSVCTNWIDEARRFAPTLRVTRLGQGDREKMLSDIGPFDVVVCSYGLLQQEIERLEKQRFSVIVVDEAQAIKNAATQRTRAAMRLVGDVRLALTGTPVENHLGELWSIMTFLNPGLLGSAKSFETRFVKPIQRDNDEQATRLLKRLVRPFILRRKKNEVLDDLPEKTTITLRVEASPEERALFEALREQALERMSGQDAGQKGRIRILAELMRLRRAACHPDLVAPEAQLTSSKLATFEAVLEELRQGGHRALVFSQFVDYLSIVRARLDALGIRYQYLDGSCTTAQRAAAVRDFQAGQGEVFLISLKAGGFGLNLTAADYVVHLDPWWNPAVEDQASDRAHRIGQTRPVTIYRLVMAGSIEEKILALHATKRDVADQLLDGASSASVLAVDELMALLRDSEHVPTTKDRGPQLRSPLH